MMFRCLLLCSVIFVSVSFQSHAEEFLQGTEDVPLMPDFQVSHDDTFSFDDDEELGRLLFSKALTRQSSDQVLEFYNKTLLELGWKKGAHGTFEREGDTLKIVVQPDKNGFNSVFFELITK